MPCLGFPARVHKFSAHRHIVATIQSKAQHHTSTSPPSHLISPKTHLACFFRVSDIAALHAKLQPSPEPHWSASILIVHLVLNVTLGVPIHCPSLLTLWTLLSHCHKRIVIPLERQESIILAPAPGSYDVAHRVLSTPVSDGVRVLVHIDPVESWGVIRDHAHQPQMAFLAWILEVPPQKLVTVNWTVGKVDVKLVKFCQWSFCQ